MGKSLKWGWLAAALVCAGSAMAAGKSGKVDAAQIGANIDTAFDVSASPTLQRWQAGGTVVLGVREAAVPMSYAIGANEKFVGYHMELCERVVHAIAPRAQLKYMVLTPQNTMPLINNGTADFNCASMTNNLTRQQQVAFGLTTYVSEVRMAVRADSDITSFKQLQGRNVGAITGTTAVQILRKYASDNELNFKTLMSKDQFESFLMLESGRVDAFVLDDNMLAGVIGQSQNPKGYKIVGEVIGAEPIAIQFSKNDPQIKKAVDGAILQMIRSGELHKLYNKWFMQPTPPNNAVINLPLAGKTKEAWANPNNKPAEDYKF